MEKMIFDFIPGMSVYAEDRLPRGPFKTRVLDRMARANKLTHDLELTGTPYKEARRLVGPVLDSEFPDVKAWYDSLG